MMHGQPSKPSLTFPALSGWAWLIIVMFVARKSNYCPGHEKPHGPKIQRKVQNLFVSPDTIVLRLSSTQNFQYMYLSFLEKYN